MKGPAPAEPVSARMKGPRGEPYGDGEHEETDGPAAAAIIRLVIEPGSLPWSTSWIVMHPAPDAAGTRPRRPTRSAMAMIEARERPAPAIMSRAGPRRRMSRGSTGMMRKMPAICTAPERPIRDPLSSLVLEHERQQLARKSIEGGNRRHAGDDRGKPGAAPCGSRPVLHHRSEGQAAIEGPGFRKRPSCHRQDGEGRASPSRRPPEACRHLVRCTGPAPVILAVHQEDRDQDERGSR